jgi:hypothetical protein
MELVGFYVLLAALLIGAVGYLWLLIVAFQQRVLWGLGLLFFPPLALVFIPVHWRKAAWPALLLLGAGVIFAVPYGVNYIYQRHVDLGPRERVVDGELHITLTGWDGTDYSILQQRPQVVVLQMANPDVNDQTLEHLKGMEQLRELDLNDTQVTDEGLHILAGLPQLETLRLRKAPITDEGFRKVLFDKESLQELDLTGTKVASKTMREWRKAKPGRRGLP